MEKIEKFVTNDENKIFRLRVLLSKLRAHISLYNQNPNHDLEKMKQLVHEIEFDFGDYHMTQGESDIVAEAHYILNIEFNDLVEKLILEMEKHEKFPFTSHHSTLIKAYVSLQDFIDNKYYKSDFIKKDVQKLLDDGKRYKEVIDNAFLFIKNTVKEHHGK